MNKLKVLLQLRRYFGWRWLVFRLSYAIKLRTGWFRRRFPPFQWSDRPLSFWLRPDVPSKPTEYGAWRDRHQQPFFFDELPSPEALNASRQPLNNADCILEGRWKYFAHLEYDVGMPPNWHLNPLTGQTIPCNRHWSVISDFDSGDIKFVWEASRFSVVFPLVRAYAASRDSKYATAFWNLIADWAKNNPPHLGPNWKCGQEASFRVMAWCFGLYAFRGQSTPDQIAQLVTMIAAHGDRIEGNIDYAQSQNNNHGVSEGVGLWTIGTLFPELKAGHRWAQIGKRVIEDEIQKQVFADGSYAQFSPNYQRVMLHDAIWALRLGELVGDRFSDQTYEKVSKSVEFLLGLLDYTSGQMPNHGANDSALILPLNDADPIDFRPALQAAHYLVHRKRIFADCDEDLVWLFGEEAVSNPSAAIEGPIVHKPLSAPIGGYYTLREANSWMMIRCADYPARPHHADQLHIDFWWRGINILCDAGTYLYNGDPPWNNGLATTAVHNTVIVDGRDQMTPYSRFLWLDWSSGVVHHHTPAYWEGSHNGYEQLDAPVTHRRAVKRLDEVWVIVDDLISTARHSFSLHWLLPEMTFDIDRNKIALHTSNGSYFVHLPSPKFAYSKTRKNSVLGWRSRSYGKIEPALSFTVTNAEVTSQRYWTVLTPTKVDISQLDEEHLLIGEHRLTLGGNQLIMVDPT